VVIVPVLVLCLRISTKVSKSLLPVTLPLSQHQYHTLGYPAANTSTTIDTHYFLRPEVHSRPEVLSLFAFHFCWSGWSGSSSSPAFTCALIHANITSHTTSTSLLSPPTHNSLSLHNLCIQEGHLHSTCQLSHLFLCLLLVNSNEKWWRHHQHCISGIITPIQFLVKSWTLHQTSQHLHNLTRFRTSQNDHGDYLCVGINTPLSLQESW